MDEDIDEMVQAIAAASPHDRPALFWEVHTFAMAARDHLHPIRISIRLRDAGHLELGKMVLLASLSVPDQRRNALYEMAVALSRQGRAAEALASLSDLQAEFGLVTYQAPLLALQYARLGRFPEAEDLLETALDRDSSFQHEFSICYEFVRYFQQFPPKRADALYDHVKKSYRHLSTAEIEGEIAAALLGGRPYVLLRMGDGEGSHTRISPEDEQAYADLYRSNRGEFHQIWFSHLNHLGSPAWSAVMNAYDDAVEHADCLGGFDLALIRHEYRIGSRRGIPAMVNLLRAALVNQRRHPQRAAATTATGLVIHYDLLLSGALERLLTGKTWIGLVSCHAGLPEALMRRFNIQHVEFYQIPGEVGRRHILGQESTSGEHFPGRYDNLRAELATAPAGRLYLVAAGILGKVYCRQLQQAGGVVVDIGAVADLWMGKPTRDFPVNSNNHVLIEKTDQE
jgi:tetratricopeptide (TPR) repeat protein